MADVNHAHAPRLQPRDDGEEPLRIRLREAARRLVENHHARFARERAGDFHELLLRDGKRAHRRIRRQVAVAEFRERAPRRVAHRAAPQPAETRRLRAEHDVLGHGQIRREVQLLVDHRHSRAPRLVRIARRKRRAVQRDAPRVRLVRAAEDFHQRALPRAILADERMHLALADAQRNAPQRGSRAEAFTDAFESKPVRHRDDYVSTSLGKEIVRDLCYVPVDIEHVGFMSRGAGLNLKIRVSWRS